MSRCCRIDTPMAGTYLWISWEGGRETHGSFGGIPLVSIAFFGGTFDRVCAAADGRGDAASSVSCVSSSLEARFCCLATCCEIARSACMMTSQYSELQCPWNDIDDMRCGTVKPLSVR